MNGQLVCMNHGGKTPEALATGKRRQTYEDILSRASRIVACDETDPQTPEEGLLLEVAWSGQVAKALAEVCQSLIDDNQLTTKSSGHGEQLNALLRMWADERVTHARLAKLALDAGIAVRNLDLVEAQAVQIVSAMLASASLWVLK
jgi:hypothetical protein